MIYKGKVTLKNNENFNYICHQVTFCEIVSPVQFWKCILAQQGVLLFLLQAFGILAVIDSLVIAHAVHEL